MYINKVTKEIISMSHVKIKEIPFNERYVNLALDEGILTGPMLANLKCLYEFIGRNSPGNCSNNDGNAFRAILKKARTFAGSRKYIISKRQVAALIRAKGGEYASSIKIPYASDYIFRAIFEIFDGYRNNPLVAIPPEIMNIYGQVRRDVFYGIQSSQYEYKYTHNLLNDREDLRDIRRDLLNDLCSEDCTLGKQV